MTQILLAVYIVRGVEAGVEMDIGHRDLIIVQTRRVRTVDGAIQHFSFGKTEIVELLVNLLDREVELVVFPDIAAIVASDDEISIHGALIILELANNYAASTTALQLIILEDKLVVERVVRSANGILFASGNQWVKSGNHRYIRSYKLSA